MSIPESEVRMEGWLFLISSTRFGLNNSKRYFVLEANCLKSYKTKPISYMEEAVRSAIIDSCTRITDNGRECINRKVLFIFTLCSPSNQRDHLKLGASSSEEAARWIHSLQEAALKEFSNPTKNLLASSSARPPSRMNASQRMEEYFVDWNVHSCITTEAMTFDVIAPSPWKIFGCRNGLRLFKEIKDKDSRGRGDQPALMAVSVIEGTSEAIFQSLMSFGPSRSEWDFCLYQGRVVDHIDGHTNIIHKQLYSNWLPRGMKRRDLLLRCYWRREDDGTYVILYHSVNHKQCPPQRGYVRAFLKRVAKYPVFAMSRGDCPDGTWGWYDFLRRKAKYGANFHLEQNGGGFIVTPVNKGKQSIVKHILAIDWKCWKLYLQPSSARSITICMLERVAALRELFKAKAGDHSSKFPPFALINNIELPLSEKEDIKTEILDETHKVEELVVTEYEVDKPLSHQGSLVGLDDSDEFFDVPESTDYDQFENELPSELTSDQHSLMKNHRKLSMTAGLVKRVLDLAVEEGPMDLQDVACEKSTSYSYGATLQEDSSCNLPCSWTIAEPSSFTIRGKSYLKDNQKVKANGTLMQMVGADWLRSNKVEEYLGSRPGSIVQQYAARGGPEFFFIVNLQLPGSSRYTIALYYMMETPLEDNPLLKSFVDGDDAYRNSRFKLIPCVSKGPWIVKQSVGSKACLLGQAIDVHYNRGKNYIEVVADSGSSSLSRGVTSLVIGCMTNLVIEIAFLIQADTEEELPEVLIGTCRLNHLDASKAFRVKS